VLRLRSGDEVSVFDGRGTGFRGVLESVSGSRAVVRLAEPESPRVEPATRVTLFQGIPHGDRMDWIVEKATEIGAARIVPVLSERSVMRPRRGSWGRLDRWRRIAVAAAKQSGRLVVPDIAEPESFDDVVGRLRDGNGARLVFHTTADPVGRLAMTAGEASIIVGPEGGWSEAEIGLAVASGFTAIGLGPRILRSDTAATVALALVVSWLEYR
jgi:16S rRNA (uracil1498-N3)-methyltransferase